MTLNVFRRGSHSDSKSPVADARSKELADGKALIERLAHEHYGMVFRFCARRVGIDRAADAAQETFVTAIRAVDNFRGDSEAKTWLLGIANNECRRVCRRDQISGFAVEFDADQLPATGSDTDWIDREVLRNALATLSDDHREAVIMKEIEGMTYDEISLVAGVPAGTVKSRVHHAMIQLRLALKETQ